MDFSRDGLPFPTLNLPSGRRLNTVKVEATYQVYIARDGMRVLASYDTEGHGRLLHVSVSYKSRIPPWLDLIDVCAGFGPLVSWMMVLPRSTEHVNTHPYCLHAFQMPLAWEAPLRLLPKETINLPDQPSPPLADHAMRLTTKGFRPNYIDVAVYRASYGPDQDVVVWWDMPGFAGDNSCLYIAPTPSPWKAGFAVGAPAMETR
jgi:hypothetical protein